MYLINYDRCRIFDSDFLKFLLRDYCCFSIKFYPVFLVLFLCVCKPDSDALRKVLGTVDAWEQLGERLLVTTRLGYWSTRAQSEVIQLQTHFLQAHMYNKINVMK